MQQGYGQRMREPSDSTSEPWGNGQMPPSLPPPPTQQSEANGRSSGASVYVELQVTNLDQSIDQREMKRILNNLFREHVDILSVSVFYQSDGNMVACIRIPSMQDAQFAISRLHRKKLGSKRIILSYSHSHAQNMNALRTKVISLLHEVPSRKLPLFKFREMFEKRFHASVGVSDLYRMKDTISVTEENSGRMVRLIVRGEAPGLTASSGELGGVHMMDPFGMSIDPSFCPIHSAVSNESDEEESLMGWAEKESDCQLPYVTIRLADLSKNLRIVLVAHSGSIPLASFVRCYNADIEPKLVPDPENGVPLEHLLGCLKGYSIIGGGDAEPKRIIFHSPEHFDHHHSGRNNGQSSNCPSQLLGQLSLFTRELIDLFKGFPGSVLPFSKFIPAYHHHFGRQCRVADYGHTRLRDVFESIPNTVQILGEGTKSLLTLSHRSQVKRFTGDLLRILKGLTNKSTVLGELGKLYEAEFGSPLRLMDYGVCVLEDILFDIPENSIGIQLAETLEDSTLLIHQREQTREEIERTAGFAKEVVELLKHAPNCSLPFTKFIPAYHHHFARQCRVSDYGFNKLLDLLEAIPGTVSLSENAEGERVIRLVEEEMMEVLGEQLTNILRFSPGLSPQRLNQGFLATYGYPLRPENVGAESLLGLLERFEGDLLELRCVTDGREKSGGAAAAGGGKRVFLSEGTLRKLLCGQVKEFVADRRNEKITKEDFVKEFEERYETSLDLDQIMPDLDDWLEISTDKEGRNFVSLKSVKVLMLNIQTLLKENCGRIRLSDLERIYLEKFKSDINPGAHGFANLSSLLSSFANESINLRGRRPRKILILSGDHLSSYSTPSCSLGSSHPPPGRSRRPPRLSSVLPFSRQQSARGGGGGEGLDCNNNNNYYKFPEAPSNQGNELGGSLPPPPPAQRGLPSFPYGRSPHHGRPGRPLPSQPPLHLPPLLMRPQGMMMMDGSSRRNWRNENGGGGGPGSGFGIQSRNNLGSVGDSPTYSSFFSDEESPPYGNRYIPEPTASEAINPIAPPISSSHPILTQPPSPLQPPPPSMDSLFLPLPVTPPNAASGIEFQSNLSPFNLKSSVSGIPLSKPGALSYLLEDLTTAFGSGSNSSEAVKETKEEEEDHPKDGHHFT